MMRSVFRAAWLGAALVFTGVLAACSGDDVLAPPDGTACTVGTVAPGDSLDGGLGATSCSVWSDQNSVQTTAASWTLHAKAHTAYVVRVYHRADTAAFDNWLGDVYVYDRNAAGDAEWAGAEIGSFGSSNGNGGYSRELAFASAKAQTVSIRIEASSPADTGLYTIVVESCAAPALANAVTSAPVAVESSCTMLNDNFPGHIAFWTFTGDTLNGNSVTFTRTSGSGLFFSAVTGEGLDFNCSSSQCTYDAVADSIGPVTIYPTFYLPGTFTAWALVTAGDSATMTAALATGPFAAPRPPKFTRPAPTAGHR